MTDSRFRPVVALDVDGVIRVDAPAPVSALVTDQFPHMITMTRERYPTYLHREPEWDIIGRWTAKHWFSGTGVAWVHSLLERGIDVVWATTWQEYANEYFGPLLGFPELPVAVHGSGRFGDSSPAWKTRQLARQFDHHPLLWVDDNPPYLTPLEDYRLRQDRIITNFHQIRHPHVGITHLDVQAMNAWLGLTLTAEGHHELRTQRSREQSRRRTSEHRATWGSEPNYRAWLPVRKRLETELNLTPNDVSLLASYVRTHAGNIHQDDIMALMTEWSDVRPVPAVAIAKVLAQYLPRPDATL